MEAAHSSKILVTTYKTTQHHNPKDHNWVLQLWGPQISNWDLQWTKMGPKWNSFKSRLPQQIFNQNLLSGLGAETCEHRKIDIHAHFMHTFECVIVLESTAILCALNGIYLCRKQSHWTIIKTNMEAKIFISVCVKICSIGGIQSDIIQT
jgi:hypothetical protein